MTSLAHVVVLASAVAVAGAKVGWMAAFLVRCWLGAAGEPRRVQAAVGRARRSSAQLLAGAAGPTLDDHTRYVEAENGRLEVMLVVGSVGLAAWSQLFVSSDSGPANQLSDLTLALLFGGSACLFFGPLLWRAEGVYITRIGRTSALDVGYAFIALALASAVVDLVGPSVAPVGPVLAVLVATRQLAEVRQVLHAEGVLNFGPLASARRGPRTEPASVAEGGEAGPSGSSEIPASLPAHRS